MILRRIIVAGKLCWDSRALFLLGAFVALVSTVSASSSALAAPVPDGPRLAVVKHTLFPFHFKLETIDETGALPMPLAGGGLRERPLPHEFIPPSWAPDGSMIVFVALASKLDHGPRGIRLYVSSADGSGVRRLKGTHGADEPKFAPDGRTVFFTRYRFRPRVNRRGKKEFVPRGASIWSVDVFGGAPTRVTPSRNGLWMFPSSFSLDGRALLASRFAGRGPWNVVKLQLDTGGSNVLLRRAADAVYSPDGQRISFIRSHRVGNKKNPDEESSSLFTVRSGGGELQRLTRGPGYVYSQSWDPSGERLAFIRYPPERSEPDLLGYGSAVLQVNADGSCLSQLLAHSRDAAFFGVAWQPGPGREAGRIQC